MSDTPQAEPDMRAKLFANLGLGCLVSGGKALELLLVKLLKIPVHGPVLSLPDEPIHDIKRQLPIRCQLGAQFPAGKLKVQWLNARRRDGGLQSGILQGDAGVWVAGQRRRQSRRGLRRDLPARMFKGRRQNVARSKRAEALQAKLCLGALRQRDGVFE